MYQQEQQSMAVRSDQLQRPFCWRGSLRNRSCTFRRSQGYHENRRGVNEWQMEPLPDVQMKRGSFLGARPRDCAQRKRGLL